MVMHIVEILRNLFIILYELRYTPTTFSQISYV